MLMKIYDVLFYIIEILIINPCDEMSILTNNTITLHDCGIGLVLSLHKVIPKVALHYNADLTKWYIFIFALSKHFGTDYAHSRDGRFIL